ncbi:MAG: methyltransferase [Candidatus Omnitrophica bacterium]|nr:methyltransferase [Candidatus Omnitrophota bacterium]MBU4479723.1 methyltransferase [Candidatus Omnitrophota bacterium]MCG2703220.1 methyltransferase [Candidatus Omnitrophota bacterium]
MIDMNKKETILITCGRGIVPYLRHEVESLGYPVLSAHDTGLEVQASFADTLRLNLCLRTGLHVMYLLKKFSCRGPDQLYREVGALAWEEIISPAEYLSVVSVTDTPEIKNSMFASQKVKDAVVDRIVKKQGSRPSSGPERDNVVINLFWKKDRCWLYLDTSGNKLSDRTYRKIPHSAPLQETLAAAVLFACGYDGSVPLVNPMCGSGTLAIEACLIALRRAPGLLRDNFAFMHLKNFNETDWRNLRGETAALCRKHPASRVIASDIDKQAIEIAKKNARAAGVEEMIEFHVCDFSETPVAAGNGIVILNPEYGLRLGKDKELGQVYKCIGDFFKQKCPGYTGYVFTGNLAMAKQVGLRTSRRIPFFNARIECRLLEYQLYEGR